MLGADLILAARREDRLTEISKELESKFSIDVTTLSMDVQNYEFVKYGIDKLDEKWTRLIYSSIMPDLQGVWVV